MAPLAASLSALRRDGDLDFDDIDLLTRMVDAMICKVAFSDAEFERTATSFDNPDRADVALHCYRVRWGWRSPILRFLFFQSLRR
jgi:hypothetical protein